LNVVDLSRCYGASQYLTDLINGRSLRFKIKHQTRGRGNRGHALHRRVLQVHEQSVTISHCGNTNQRTSELLSRVIKRSLSLSNRSGDTKLSSLALRTRVYTLRAGGGGGGGAPENGVEQWLEQLLHEVGGLLLAQLNEHGGANTAGGQQPARVARRGGCDGSSDRAGWEDREGGGEREGEGRGERERGEGGGRTEIKKGGGGGNRHQRHFS
jgi:hypothetical protein